MPTDQIFIGAMVAGLCSIGVFKSRWFLQHTGKGKWLAEKCGEQTSLWMLRGLLGTGAFFGILLACNVIRPLQW